MKTKFNLLLFLLLSVSIMAQEKIVNGNVTSTDDNLPLPGVNVIVKELIEERVPILTAIIQFRLIQVMFWSLAT